MVALCSFDVAIESALLLVLKSLRTLVCGELVHRSKLSKHMINPRISADWSTSKPIATFS